MTIAITRGKGKVSIARIVKNDISSGHFQLGVGIAKGWWC